MAWGSMGGLSRKDLLHPYFRVVRRPSGVGGDSSYIQCEAEKDEGTTGPKVLVPGVSLFPSLMTRRVI